MWQFVSAQDPRCSYYGGENPVHRLRDALRSTLLEEGLRAFQAEHSSQAAACYEQVMAQKS